MAHLEKWERARGHLRENNGEEELPRNPRVEDDPLRCKWPDCGKVCKSKGGLVIHQRRMHHQRQAEPFKCRECGMSFQSENVMVNHMKTCGGVRNRDPNQRTCEKCGAQISKANIARHR